jgi:uncharacterized membrane protein
MPPTPPTPYGAPPSYGGGPAPYSATAAISYGWNKFTQNPGPLLLVTLSIFVVSIIFEVISSVIQAIAAPGITNSCDPNSADYLSCLTDSNFGLGVGVGLTTSLLVMVLSVLSSLASVFLQGGLYRGALLIVDGQTPTIGEMFQGWAKGRYLITVILMAIIVVIGVVLCIIPGIVAAFLLMFAPMLVVDNSAGSITDPLKRSYEIVKNNVGSVLLFWLITVGVTILGFLACCVGLLVALPLVTIAQAYTVRKLEGRPVAP